MNWKVPFFDLQLGEEEKRAVLAVLESNWLSSGPKVAAFESAFAGQMQLPAPTAIAVTNCTVALHLALAALDIGPGDEVICPSLTFVATVNSIRYTGATPIFADVVSEREWNIDPADIETKITRRTKAILVMHYAGYPCRMAEILQLAEEYNLYVVEDACHGPLAEWEGRKLGTIGDIGCFSFFSNKNMTTGEGGMVVTKHLALADKIRQMRSHGMTATSFDRFKGHAFGYDVTVLGYNYRMDEIRAAIGIEQLKKLPVNNKRRKALIAYYRQVVQQFTPEIVIPFADWDGEYGYHIFPILLPSGYSKRNKLMHQLLKAGIQTSIHYRPVHSFVEYQSYLAEVPTTEAIQLRILSLPLYPTLEHCQIDYLLETLQNCLYGKQSANSNCFDNEGVVQVGLLFDPQNDWIRSYLVELSSTVEFLDKYEFNYSHLPEEIAGSEVVFVLGYTKILPKSFLDSNGINLVVHESDLPQGKGFSPVQWQVLAGKNRIPVCLFEATESVDAGDIVEKGLMELNGYELFAEIRKKQALVTLDLIKKFLRKYPNYTKVPQCGEETTYRRRTVTDDRLDVDKTIREQFDHLRIADNHRYPLHFVIEGHKYYLHIFPD